MEIRDPVHGSIHIKKTTIPVIRHPFFQRLRNIKQLGFSEYIFPGATHNRFIHSIGVMWVGERCFKKIFAHMPPSIELEKLEETLKLACLLHDIGHAPLSHSTETVMPHLEELNIPKSYLTSRNIKTDKQASHEDYTIKSIIDSSFTESFKLAEDQLGIDKEAIADLVLGRTPLKEYFTLEGIDYFPLLSQLVSSELDCDRMDYLLRDSYFCGVSYGQYDLDWLIDNLEIHVEKKTAYLGITEKAVVTFDDFLLSRYHMFLMVYFHYRAVCLEQLLYKYFESEKTEYRIPASIEEYIEHDDHLLMKVLRKSKNKYAKAIITNNIPEKVFESFNSSQLKILKEIEQFFIDEKVEYIRCSSAGRLSKYYAEEANTVDKSLRVIRKLQNGKKSASNIDQATDLFKKFSKSHEVNRLHCDLSELTKDQANKFQELLNKYDQ